MAILFYLIPFLQFSLPSHILLVSFQSICKTNMKKPYKTEVTIGALLAILQPKKKTNKYGRDDNLNYEVFMKFISFIKRYQKKQCITSQNGKKLIKEKFIDILNGENT